MYQHQLVISSNVSKDKKIKQDFWINDDIFFSSDSKAYTRSAIPQEAVQELPTKYKNYWPKVDSTIFESEKIEKNVE